MNELIVLSIIILLIILTRLLSKSSSPKSKKLSADRNTYEDFDSDYEDDYSNTIEVSISIDDILSKNQNQFRSKNHYNKKENYRWIPKGETVTIGNHTIISGFFYTGEFMKSVSNYSIEPSFISPKLSKGNSNNEIGYWPVFNDLSLEHKNIYLSWLEKGRIEVLKEIGYVFIFLYGLERRILKDMYKDKKRDDLELELLVAEIKRLILDYKDNRSFSQYAVGLIDFVCVAFNKYDKFNDETIDLEKFKTNYEEYPIILKMKLANYINETEKVSSELALLWLRSSPFSYLRTPAIRCGSEFEYLFNSHFNLKYKNGMGVKPNKTKIKYHYRPASNSFPYDYVNIKTDIVDYTAQSRPLNNFKKIAELATDMLDPYSRYLGRNPDDTNSIKALSLLPEEVFKLKESDIIIKVKSEYVQKLEGTNHIMSTVKSLTGYLEYPVNSSLKKNDVVSIIQFLGKFNIGIEPDIRFGSPQFNIEDKILMFSIGSNNILAPSKEYSAALLIATLGLILSAADGNISSEEIEQILVHIKENLQLNKAELERLNYFIRWGQESNIASSKLISKLKTIKNENKDVILSFLLNLANADGQVSPEEIKILKKVYKTFERDENSLYSDIHQMQVGTQDLATIVQKDKTHSNYKIPSEQKKTDRLILNQELINRTLAETDEVQSLLTSIFDDESETIPHEIEKPIISQHTLFNLDRKHSELVKELIKHNSWDENEFISLCESYNLMPHGAIENINEAVFEKLEDDLIYEEENIEINQNILQEILDVC